ncbi:T9SS type B sorting domain-containing protein [Epilithonimonas mollis]|uniref:Gliding motility-associated C-terminal domain-containing protein n=1 Tax=Epilithonimonas mollis TaxID=216903 RepID=A0A1M6P8Y6_9FLAO|nr:T9SS type B sorting domain-containing protein [Epilithonimonas mollis]SHK04352.1 gliding motility-associated C-terminal domain-containing protein [Epilithonimonas mollis]
MNKSLLILLFFITSINLFGQLDTEHWFAPMVDRTANPNTVQRIYMSTNETTPFKVEVYNNNVIIGTVTISKNNPKYYEISNRSMIIARPPSFNPSSDLFKPVNKGIYLKGEKYFFASLRFSVSQHAEILTSKGTAGIGTDFRVAMAPIMVYNEILNFMTSVMATENNTNVTISGFDPNVKFSDGVSRTQFNFTLNKGQSYIIDGIGDQTENFTGFIGAKITADKPISVTNGNFNGQYAGDYPSASDILMDQAVPEDKLGKTFILVKGNGANSYVDPDTGSRTTMEKAIIVAVKDNTEIYLNDDTVPAKILQTGEFFETAPDSYKDQGSGHYNLYISSNNNIYVYQLLAGIEIGNPPTNGNGQATGGFNYIPPLSCYLPNRIDEIGLINENRVFISNINNYRNQIPTKMNIITERGATVDVKSNGTSLVLSAANGPFDVTGNSQWVTYSIPNITGNVAVFSSRAVTAGISAGDDAVGYGGYFAGFSYLPAIIRKEGECVPDVVLQLPEGFDFYQWMKKNQATGLFEDITGANTNLYKPTEAGYYKARVKQGSCAEVNTTEFKFLSCLSYTAQFYQTCKDLTLVPKLTLGNQGVIGSSISIVKQPLKGTVTIDAVTKTISYTANPNVAGADSFRYKFIGDDPITPESEEVLVNIDIKNIVASDRILKGCKISNTIGEFDLTKADVTLDTSVTKTFYKDHINADNDTGVNTIATADLGHYQSSEGEIFVRLNNGFCPKTVKVELRFAPIPDIVNNTYEACDLDFKGAKVKLDQVARLLLKDPVYFTNVKFYLNPVATAGTELPNDFTYSANTTLHMVVFSPDGCTPVKFAINLKVGTRLALTKTLDNYTLCDPNLDDSENVNLDNYKNLFLSVTDVSDTALKTYFYLSLNDAQRDINRLPNGNVTITKDVDYHFRFEKNGICPNVGSLSIRYTKGFASLTLQPEITICESATVQVDGGTAHVKWQWTSDSDPAYIIPPTQKVTLKPGKYHVILKSKDSCDYNQRFEIIGSPKAVLDISKLNATFCDDKFKNQIIVKLSTQVTPVILQNPHPDIKMEYYRDAAYTQLINEDNFIYSNDIRIYVKAVSKYCSETRDFIDFRIGNRVPLSNIKLTHEECDDDMDGIFTIKNLNNYTALFTSDPKVSAKFYIKEADAKNDAANNITEINVNNQQVLFVRFSNTSSLDCPNIGELTIKIKIPKKSEVLLDKPICPDDTTYLDIGPGFDNSNVVWYNENDPAKIIGTGQVISDLPVGKYFVILKGFYPNDCPIKQSVEIKAAELPEIESIEINGSTVKINATGGVKPYKYAIDNGNYQDSEIFTNISPGLHKAYVISVDNCDPAEKIFSVIEIYNAITPNGDGVNDVLDMSLLKYKIDVKFQIFDREGKKLFEGDPNNNYIWDGKQNGKPLSTSSYWYIMEWKDFEKSPPVKYTGWILLKNRN